MACHIPQRRRSAFDLEAIQAQWGSPPDEIYYSVLKIFAEEGAALYESLRAALAQENRSRLFRAAHTLAGAAANVGAIRLSECASALETAAAIGQPNALARLLLQLEPAWHKVIEEISAGGPATHGS